MENIQIGDKIIRYYSGTATGIYTVTRKTKTQIICVLDGSTGTHEVRLFDKCGTLKEFGSDRFARAYYKHATPEMLSEYHDRKKRADLIAKLQGANWSKYTTETLENICTLLNL